MPPIVARAIDTTTQPLRTARQVFEEVEEITFAFKRTHRVTVDSQETAESTQQIASMATEADRRHAPGRIVRPAARIDRTPKFAGVTIPANYHRRSNPSADRVEPENRQLPGERLEFVGCAVDDHP